VSVAIAMSAKGTWRVKPCALHSRRVLPVGWSVDNAVVAMLEAQTYPVNQATVGTKRVSITLTQPWHVQPLLAAGGIHVHCRVCTTRWILWPSGMSAGGGGAIVSVWDYWIRSGGQSIIVYAVRRSGDSCVPRAKVKESRQGGWSLVMLWGWENGWWLLARDFADGGRCVTASVQRCRGATALCFGGQVGGTKLRQLCWLFGSTAIIGMLKSESSGFEAAWA